MPVNTCVIGRKRICIAMPPVLSFSYVIFKAQWCVLFFCHFLLPIYIEGSTQKESAH